MDIKRVLYRLTALIIFVGISFSLFSCKKNDNSSVAGTIDVDVEISESNDEINESIFEKLKTVSVGDYITFGTYMQDDPGMFYENDVLLEDVEWVVLAKEENKVLVISKYALMCEPFDDEYMTTTNGIGGIRSEKHITWENSTLRKKLNDSFFNTAFSPEEQQIIAQTYVPVDDDPNYVGGNTTVDRIFILSSSEVEEYLPDFRDRECRVTEFAFRRGAYRGDGNNCNWWLRSLRSPSDMDWKCYAACVNDIGFINRIGYEVDENLESFKETHRDYVGSEVYVLSNALAVRPAMWLYNYDNEYLNEYLNDIAGIWYCRGEHRTDTLTITTDGKMHMKTEFLDSETSDESDLNYTNGIFYFLDSDFSEYGLECILDSNSSMTVYWTADGSSATFERIG